MSSLSHFDHALASGIEILVRGEDGRSKQWLAPGMGKYPVSHIETFMTRYTSASRVYRDADEALIDNRDNARYMLNDVGILECVEARRRMVSLLDWHVEPEDGKSNDQKEFCSMIEKVVRRIRNFTDYRFTQQQAIWFGKYGITHRWRAEIVNNQSVWMPRGIHSDDTGWRPLHGDKLVFRQERPDMAPGTYDGQMGIRVGMSYRTGDVINDRWRVESTDYGLAYFLRPEERRLMLVHKHHREDAAFEDGLRAGGIHGVGIRSKIYHEWKIKQETMAFLLEFVERMAGGIQIWKYPMGNKQAHQEARTAAENFNSGKEHIMLVPVPAGDEGTQYGVEVVEPGFQGIDTLHNLLKEYFNDRVKRYILGQKLSSEAEATGLGSGVAEIHMDTLLQIIKTDAHMHEETLTEELLHQIIRVNVNKGVFSEPGFRPRIVVETDDNNIQERLNGVLALMKEGIRFRLTDLYELVQMAMPGPDDETNQPQQQQAPGGMPGMPMGKLPAGKPPAMDHPDEAPHPKNGSDTLPRENPDDNEQEHPADKSKNAAHDFVMRYGREALREALSKLKPKKSRLF